MIYEYSTGYEVEILDVKVHYINSGNQIITDFYVKAKFNDKRLSKKLNSLIWDGSYVKATSSLKATGGVEEILKECRKFDI